MTQRTVQRSTCTAIFLGVWNRALTTLIVHWAAKEPAYRELDAVGAPTVRAANTDCPPARRP